MADDSSSGSSLWLPAGFRFHPTDEEIIVDYLQPKVADQSFSAVAMGEVDLNSCEPWELPRKAKMGEKMWYFFWQKDRKYPTGSRTNRATKDGYWKATGKDKEIYKLQQGSSSAAAAGKRVLVGMKKTLVFYLGRAPKGEKTNWVMHEFRLQAPSLPPSNEEWVVCRIFHKNEGIIKPKSPGAQVTECHPSSALMMSTDEGTSRQQQMSMSMSTPMIATSNNNIHQESTHYFFSQMPPPNPFFSQSGLAASGYLHLQEEAANAAAAAAAAACASTSSALTGKCKVEQAVSSSMPSRSQDTGISNDWHADTSSYDGGEVDVHSNSAGPLLNLDNIWEY